jgi:DNA-binding response OmpR family regulator
MTLGFMMVRSVHGESSLQMAPAAQIAETFFYVLDEKVRILFVDDDPILREFALVNLTSDQAEVRVAADGDEAWRLMNEESFDLVLLDLEMPDVDGFEILQSMRATPRLSRLPVVVVTGREDVMAIDKAFIDGATSFVVKPINWRLLSYQIRYVHQASRTETSLIRARAQTRSQLAEAAEALRRLAQSGARFVSAAVQVEPALRPAAETYARELAELCPQALGGADPAG